MRLETTPIDWSYWRHMPEVNQWEACALSLAINPFNMEKHPQAWMSGSARPIFTERSFPSKAVQDEFDKRMKLLEANVFKSPHFKTVNRLIVGARYKATIALNEFANWCRSIDLGAPVELLALADIKEAISGKAPSTQKHTLQSRTSILNAEIDLATKNALDPNDIHSIWGALQTLAETKTGLLIGYVDEGIQYKGKVHAKTGEPDILSFVALRGRFSRKRNSTKKP